jgi:hypothetical protein
VGRVATTAGDDPAGKAGDPLLLNRSSVIVVNSGKTRLADEDWPLRPESLRKADSLVGARYVMSRAGDAAPHNVG